MRVTGGGSPRAVFGFVLLAVLAASNAARSGAQAPPDPPQRWDGLIERLSTPGQGYPESFSNPRMSRHAVSGDGRYVVFMADVPNPPFEPGRQFFVRDRQTGQTTMWGPGSLAAPPVISSDGNHHALELCDGPRDPDGAVVCDVWTIDGRTLRVENMSTSIDGTPSVADSSEPMLSQDGRFIVFRTGSTTLLPPGAAPGQIVLRDRDPDGDGILDEPGESSVRLVSVSSSGEPGNAESAAAEVSADGRFVAFRSRASNLVPDDTNGMWDVFLHDVQSGETRRINLGWDGRQTTAAIDSPAISMSEDGAFVAFAGDDWALSNPNSTSDDNNGGLDVFVYSRAANTLSRVDLGAEGALGNGHTHWPDLSADGRYVSVVSNATNVASPGSPGRSHVFVYDRATSQATRVSVNPDGTEPDRDAGYSTLSADGSVVTFVSQATNLPTAAPAHTDTIYAAVHFDVTPLAMTLPARGGEVTATVSAQRYVSWDSRVTDPSWLYWGSSGARGMGNGTATFQAYRNYDPGERTTTVQLHSRTITVTQQAGLFVSGFSPAQGPPTGGTLVTLDGTGFEPGMAVYFNGIAAPSVEFVDPTRIRAVTPAHETGDVWIYVATADWDAAAAPLETFRFLDATPPQILPWTGGTQTADGWFTSDVQIGFGVWDPDSAIASAEGCSWLTVTIDTPGTTYTCSATSEGGTSTVSVVVKRDTSGPAIELSGLAQTIYRVGDPAPAATYMCTDALSGVAECSGALPSGAMADMTPGYHHFWVSALDAAGNGSTRLFTYAVTEGGCAVRPEGLAAWFPFETISGGTPQPTYAEPVHGSDGNPFNTQFVAGAAGSFAMAPAGPGSYVAAEPSNLFELTSGFSLAAWVKPGPVTSDFETIAGREGEYLLGISPDGTLHWSLSTPTRAWGWTRTSIQLQRDVWAHVALVYDGSQVTVYLNGITREGWSTSGQVVDVAPGLNQFRIGAREDDSSPSYFTGAIDDVLLVKRPLSAPELERIALARGDGLCGPQPTTVTVEPNPVTVAYGQNADHVFTLTLTSGGNAVAGRTLLFFEPSGLLLAPAETDANGQVRFGGTARGTTVGTQPGFEARFLGDFHYAPSSGANVLEVERAAPVITWPAPAAIAYGMPLGSGQLNASANVPGTFTYTPTAGTQLGVGTHPLSVRFDPDDSTNYRSVTATATLNVVDPTPPVIVPSAEGTLGATGWYTSDVRIAFSVQDPESAIVSSNGCGVSTITTDTTGTTYTCSAASGGGTASASLVVKRDTSAPAITLLVPAPTLYEATLAPRAMYSCADPTSGMATCQGPVANDTLFDRTPGYHTFNVVATDLAGNQSTKDVTYAIGLGQCAPRPAGFVAWWPFEEPYGAGSIASYRDVVSGTVDAGVNTDWRFGQGPAGVFAMSTAANPSAYMSAGTRAQLRLTGAFTISVWVFPTVTSEMGVIAGREGEYMLARFPDGTLRYSLATASPGWGWVDTGHVLPRTWSHVALTYDGTLVRAYVNGREVHTAAASGPIGDAAPSLNEFRVGARQDPSGLSHFTGGIDDLLLHSRALEALEIERVFLAGTKGLCGPINTQFEVQPDPIRVTYGQTSDVEIVARLRTSGLTGAPVAGRPVTILKYDTPIGSGITDVNGEVRATAAIHSLSTGTSHTAFRVQHTGDLYYASQTLYVPLLTEKAVPQIAWPAPQPIVFGNPLGAAHLNATANVGGTFAYSHAAGTVLAVGAHALSVTFTPWVPQNYTTATATVTLDVTPAIPTISLTAPAATYDGLPHGATGTVTGVGGASLGPLTFTYNGATEPPMNAGTYDVVASFAGDANHAAATATASVTIGKATTDLHWAVPGSITYGTPLGAGQLNATAASAGSFNYSPAAGAVLGAGTHTLSVTFTPADPANYTGGSASTTITVARAPLTILAVDAVKRFGAPLPAFATTASGLVNGDSIASLAGTLALSTTATQQSSVGTYPIVPSGVSSPNYSIAFLNGTLTVARGTVDVAVATSPEPSGFEAPMTFTATVAASIPAPASPTGLVRFFDGPVLIGTAPLNAGIATLSTAGLDAGTRTVEARYDGDGAFEPGVASALHLIRDASQTPALVLSSSRNPSNTGQSVTLTATVNMPAGPVSGSVQFFSGAVLLGTSPISAGRATFTTASLAAGSHAITARYTGSGGVPPAHSPVFVQSVGGTGWKNRTTSLSVTGTPNPATLGDTVLVTALVTGSSAVAPTGRILFMIDGVAVAEVAVAPVSSTAAQATFSAPGLAHGRRAISATYLGDPTYKGSTNRVTVGVN